MRAPPICELELEIDKCLHVSGNKLVHDDYCRYGKQNDSPNW